MTYEQLCNLQPGQWVSGPYPGDGSLRTGFVERKDNTYLPIRIKFLGYFSAEEGDQDFDDGDYARWYGAADCEDLELIEPPENLAIFPVSEYWAIVYKDTGEIKVGCQDVNKDALRDLVTYLSTHKML